MARDLLSRGWSNKAVAAELGFADESHFCHEFKRIYGCSPQWLAPLYRQSGLQTDPQIQAAREYVP